MIATSASELIKLFQGRFRIMLDTDWASWRDAYVQQVRTVQEADEDTWSHTSCLERNANKQENAHFTPEPPELSRTGRYRRPLATRRTDAGARASRC